MRIPLSQIRLRPHALRDIDRKSEAYSAMRDSIRKWGLFHSLFVRQIGPDQYEMLGGSNRFDIITCLGWEDVECTVFENCSDEDADFLEVESNAVHVPMTGAEYARRLLGIVRRNPGIKAASLYEAIHRNPQWIHEKMGLTELADEYLDEVFDGKLTLANALSLAKLPKPEQPAFIDDARTMKAADFGELVLARVHHRQKPRLKPAYQKQVEPRLRRFSVIKSAYEDPTRLDWAPQKWVKSILAWVLQMDTETRKHREELLQKQLLEKDEAVKRFKKYKERFKRNV